MLAEARARYPDVRFWQGDVIDLPDELGQFDVAFFNGMFGNVWNQRDALASVLAQLTATGRIVISHPLGAAFVDRINRENPCMVPNRLPRGEALAELIDGLPLEVARLEEEEELYLCVLRRAGPA
jgi:riboflavin kinase